MVLSIRMRLQFYARLFELGLLLLYLVLYSFVAKVLIVSGFASLFLRRDKLASVLFLVAYLISDDGVLLPALEILYLGFVAYFFLFCFFLPFLCFSWTVHAMASPYCQQRRSRDQNCRRETGSCVRTDYSRKHRRSWLFLGQSVSVD
jgi:hypothetical protein